MLDTPVAYVLHRDERMSIHSPALLPPRKGPFVLGRDGKEEDIFQKTMRFLEWPELCKRLSEHALSPLGVGLCESLLPGESEAEAARQMHMTSEMAAILEREGRVPLAPFEDLSPILDRAERGERLAGAELRQVSEFLTLVGKSRGFFLKRAETSPVLWDLACLLQEIPYLKEALDISIDPEGQVKDEASATLGHLRREVRRAREEALGRIDAFLKDREASKVLQDSYYTVREGRFVLPVRADARRAMDGIVQGISSSGATHFLEPLWLVEMNNALRMAELEVEREVDRILRELSGSVKDSAQIIRQGLDVMAHLDLVHAKARFSAAIRGSRPEPSPTGHLALRGLRHPLLVLRSVPVVPNDVLLSPEERILVISGPNAGGKTVLLKSVGLALLMARGGIHVPADPGSMLPVFRGVYADIGDQQDINMDVSTFSGHMLNLRQILERVEEDSFVILDELAGSTDPQEGSKLALAFLDELCDRRARVMITTHYPALKAWAQARKGARNAAMEFDWERMEPAYRLQLGVPGLSSALEIAKRMGLPREILERARALMEGDETRLEALLRDLERERASLEKERKDLDLLKSRLEETLARHRELLVLSRKDRETFLREKRKRLSSEIQDARRRIRDALASLERARTRKDVEMVRGQIRDLEAELRPPPVALPSPPRPLGDVGPGDAVMVLPLGQVGVLLEHPSDGKGRVRVKLGGMEVVVGIDALAGVDREDADTSQGAPPGPSGLPPIQEIPSQIDLRGMRVEEAMADLERYLDKALMSRREEVRIIHGHGTGALKQAVRTWLSASTWASSFRPGGRGEGGDGVTVVTLHHKD